MRSPAAVVPDRSNAGRRAFGDSRPTTSISKNSASLAFEHLISRPLEILYEINRRFLDDVRSRFPNDLDRVRRMSLIEEGPTKRVRMAHLAMADDRAFVAGFRQAARAAKVRLVDWLHSALGETVDPETIFDSQIKRIHSDRAIAEYAADIWNVKPCPVP